MNQRLGSNYLIASACFMLLSISCNEEINQAVTTSKSAHEDSDQAGMRLGQIDACKKNKAESDRMA